MTWTPGAAARPPDRRRFASHVATLLAAAAAPGTGAAAAVADEAVVRSGARAPLHLRLRLPAAASPWPLLVYSHGLGGHLDSGSVWTRAWSALGFLCVHVRHEATSEALFEPADATATQQRVQAALAQDQVPPRCAEVAAALDHLLAPGQAWARRVDPRVIVIAGHSYGALAAMALAGRRLPQAPNGSLQDRRFTAAIALSPGVNPIGRGEEMATVRVPMLCVTGSLDAQVEIGVAPRRVRAGVPLANRLAVYRGLPAARRRLLYLEGADHMSLAGEAAVDTRFFSRAPGWVPGEEARLHAAVVEHTGAFLRQLRAPEAAPWPPGHTNFPGGFVLSGLDLPGGAGRR